MKPAFQSSGAVALAALTYWFAALPAPAQSGWGNALSVDGTNDYVEVSGMLLTNRPLTIELWAKRESASTWDAFVGQGWGAGGKGLFFALQADSRAVFSFYAGGLYTTNAYTDSVWHHWAATYDPATGRRIYRDGVLIASDANTAPYTGTGSLLIGTVPWWVTGNAFDGQIDDVRIWEVARSESEIAANMRHPLTGTESNLVAYWKFDESSGAIAHDATTNEWNGALVNGPTWTNSTIPPFIDINAGLPKVADGAAAWGDYDNDGELDFLLTGQDTNYLRIANIYRSNGDGTFTNINAGLPGVDASAPAWGDYDSDSDLDLLLTGSTGSVNIAHVYRNDGGEVFTNVNAGLPGVRRGSAAWGDCDNDGDLDILLTGSTDTGYISRIYRNEGAGVFTNINAGLAGVSHSAAAWGDYDNDDDLDLVLAGYIGSGTRLSAVYRNDGDGVFIDASLGLPGIMDGSVAWGDYNNDGHLDLFIAGATGIEPYYNPICRVYRNNGDGSFALNTNAALPGVCFGPIVLGDYDTDGDLDVLLSGVSANAPAFNLIARIYSNNGDESFTHVDAGLPGVGEACAAWGDYDNDGRLDLLLAGNTDVFTDYLVAQVWRNVGPAANTPPSSPADLAATAVGHEATLSWSAASDGQTPASGLTYNLRVGTTPGGFDVVSPQAASNGLRRLPAMGNAQHDTAAVFQNLPWGVYYWSVQAVDSAFAGSPFAEEPSFVVAVETVPATYLTHKSQTLGGMVSPLGYSTTVWFQWGLTTNYGNTTPAENLGSGTNVLQVSCVVTAWTTGTYHYRIFATNNLGLHVGADEVFTIQSESPTVVTLPATSVTASTATFRGEVNPRWAQTLAWFEYGLTTKYGAVTAVTNLGNGPDPLPVGIPVSGLLPWMTYHYRAMASNSLGIAVGTDTAFTLPGPFGPGSEPWLSGLPDVAVPQGGNTSFWFTVSPADLDVRVHCNNPVLLPDTGIGLTIVNSNSLLNLVPDPNHSGLAQITVTASDGMRGASDSFTLTVTPWDTDPSQMLYLEGAHVVSNEAWRFHLVDLGTASTNYAVEYRSDLSPTNNWTSATNVTDLGSGLYEVDTGPPQGDTGFYRVKGFRLLLAGFDSTEVTADEGTGAAGAVIVFNGIYTGTVSYSWSDEQGLTWTNHVQVDGTTAVIPIPATFLSDNTSIGQLRSLTLQLEGGTGFTLGAPTESTVTIEENDADWQGVLQTPGGTLGFTLTVLETNGNFQGQIRSQGFGFFPTDALAQLTFSERAFTAVATNVRLSVLMGTPALSFTNYLDLRLDATNAPGETNVSSTKLQGVATLVSRVPTRPHLDSAAAGSFVLQRPPTAPSTNEVLLNPAP